MIGSWFGRWPRLIIRRKGGRLGATSRVVSLARWSHVGRPEVGDGVMLLSGAKLGDHCLVGARAVVRGAILTGKPVTITGQLTDEPLAAKREAVARDRFHIRGGAS